MDSRIRLGDGFSVPQHEKAELQFGGAYMPATPNKPIPIRPGYAMLDNGNGSQLGSSNWQELDGFRSGYAQDMLNYNSAAQHFGEIEQFGGNGFFPEKNGGINNIAGSYTQLLLNQNASWNSYSFTNLLAMNDSAPVAYENRNLNKRVSMAEKPLIPNLNTPVECLGESNWGDEFVANQTQCSSSGMLDDFQSLFQMPQYGFPTPYNPNYDPNSLPSIEADTNTFQFTPMFEQAKQLEDQLSALVNSPQESLNVEKDVQDNLVDSVDNVPNQQNTVDASSAVISSPFEEPKDSCQESNQVIDLNKTPQQKTPKRRKHRPKVIVEGKPKRTPKATTTNKADPNKKTTEKRKYVRKNNQQELASPHPDSIGDNIVQPNEKRKYVRKNTLKEPETQNTDDTAESTDPSARTTASSCKRVLNFEAENTCSEKGRNKVTLQDILYRRKETFNLNTGNQAAESSQQTNMVYRTSELQVYQQNGSLSEIQQSVVGNCNASMNRMSNNQFISNGREAFLQLPSRKDGQMNNLIGTGRGMNVSMLQNDWAKLNCRSLENNGPVMPPSTESVTRPSAEGKGYKRGNHHLEPTKHSTENPLGDLFCRERLHTDDYHLNSSICSAAYSETHKKQKAEIGTQKNMNGISPPFLASNLASTVERNRELLRAYIQRNYNSNRYASGQELAIQQRCPASSLYKEIIGENCNMFPPTPPQMSQFGQQLKPPNCNIDASEKQVLALTQSLSVPSIKDQHHKQLDVLKNQQSTAKRKGGRPAKKKGPITIEDIIYQMERLNLNETAIVPYKGDGTLVPYAGLEFIKKRKPRPKVDLDPETERVWNLLMWKEEDESLQDTDEKNQHWEEERRIFHGRVDSFIARMHLVQGDRRFSKWKGSVVDSVIGVFLTQNVSDHLSSSAFMHLAAKYPPKSMKSRTCEKGPIIMVQEPVYIINPKDTIKWHENSSNPLSYQISKTSRKSMEHQRHETSWTERESILEVYSRSPEEEILSSQESVDSTVVQSNGGVRSYSGSNSEVQDPANGCKHNKYHNIRNPQQVDSTTSFEDFFSRVNGTLLSHEGTRYGHHQPEVIEDRQQWPVLDRFNDQRSSSTFNQQYIYNISQLQKQVVPSSNSQLYRSPQPGVQQVESSQLQREESISSWPSSTSRISKEKDASCTSNRDLQGAYVVDKPRAQQYESEGCRNISTADPHTPSSKQLMHGQDNPQQYHVSQPHEMIKTFQLEREPSAKSLNRSGAQDDRQCTFGQQTSNIPNITAEVFDIEDSTSLMNNNGRGTDSNFIESQSRKEVHFPNKGDLDSNSSVARKKKVETKKKDAVDWDCLRRTALGNGIKKERSEETMDSLDYEAMRNANVNEIAEVIKERGMNNMLAERIKAFLDRLVKEHGSTDLEWLRDVPPEKAKDYLLSVRGLGLKSVECVRLLTLHHLAFPVDTNVGRIAVRLGWVPLRPLPESLQLHLLELYPVLESIQKYLWPRLCKLDQRTLYELHYQMITFGKVFCTKSRPNCNACPLRAECRHFASAFASARLALPGPEDKSIVTATVPLTAERSPGIVIDPLPLPSIEDNSHERKEISIVSCVPIIEEPASPEQNHAQVIESDIEDLFDEDPDEIPTITLNMKELSENLQNYMQANMELQECEMSKALVALNPEVASIPTPKLKNVSRLRTEHQVYELPDSHPLLEGMDKREPDDPSPYLLAIWTPGETANSIQLPEQDCQFQGSDKLCNEKTCFSCNSVRETNSQTVRGTILIPCRTAMRGSFPLNGTYFQVNEVFADHESSLNPIDVPRTWIWNLPRRMVYFGTSVSTIFKGLTTEGIQYCFWKGFVCVRGFEQKQRAPRPLVARLHFPASRLVKTGNGTQQ
ncbi:transcriptional activator DEMETER [Mercurialis annua]|uniref:transcriptional activator DEMETER n=1 Tax=Mercurialis annua TaxID=3986 RepID=UPI00215FAED7|nr:transcriptional activator DEMETER [Mercurialis annua]